MIPIKMVLQVPSYENVSLMQAIWDFLIGTNNGHLWFLYALFIVFAVSYITNSFCQKINKVFRNIASSNLYVALLFCCIICIYLSNCMRIDYFCIKSALLYAFWFQLGISIHGFSIKQLILVVAISISMFFLIDKTLIISLGIVLILYFFMPNRDYRVISYIDKHSFGVYLFHSPLVYITYTYFANSNPLVVLTINFLVFGIISFFFTYLLRQSRFNIV